MKKYLLVIIALGITTAIGLFFLRSGVAPVSHVVSYTNASLDSIKVVAPLPGGVVERNFRVEGTARGTWFFEASFPVTITTLKGEVLARTPAHTNSEWMTENFVPFEADIQIVQNYSGPAKVILKKDNPSDLREHDASVSFEVVIQ